jgi:hypothetical protein
MRCSPRRMVAIRTVSNALGFLERFKRIIAALVKITFDHTPKELNKIKLTVEFRQKNTHVSRFLNDLLNERLLCLLWFVQ